MDVNPYYYYSVLCLFCLLIFVENLIKMVDLWKIIIYNCRIKNVNIKKRGVI